MESEKILYGNQAREKIKSGIDKLANAVKVTLGPNGRNVVIYDGDELHVTKDGVTVAKSIYLEDKLEDSGAKLIRDVSMKTCNDAGDGTTTSTVLAQAMISLGSEVISDKTNLSEVKRGMDNAVSAITSEIKRHSVAVDDDMLASIAIISSNGDESIGSIVSEAIIHAGRNGTIKVLPSNSSSSFVTKVDGVELDTGYVSPKFANNNKNECVLSDPRIFLYNGNISKLSEISQLIQSTHGSINSSYGSKESLFIMCNDISYEALNAIVYNVEKVGLKICIVKSIGLGNRRDDIFNDIAAITGSKVYSGNEVSSLINQDLQVCSSISVSSSKTAIVGAKGKKEAISKRSEIIKNLIQKSIDPIEIDKLNDRLSKLEGCISLINVGGYSDVEVKEKVDRIDDAVSACKAAIDEGIVPGGGTVFYKILEAKKNSLSLDKSDFDTGEYIVYNSISAPLDQLIYNSSYSGDLSILLTRNGGIDFKTKTPVKNMIKKGIIDPAKVLRSSIENSASIASMYLTTECIIVK